MYGKILDTIRYHLYVLSKLDSNRMTESESQKVREYYSNTNIANIEVQPLFIFVNRKKEVSAQ